MVSNLVSKLYSLSVLALSCSGYGEGRKRGRGRGFWTEMLPSDPCSVPSKLLVQSCRQIQKSYVGLIWGELEEGVCVSALSIKGGVI